MVGRLGDKCKNKDAPPPKKSSGKFSEIRNHALARKKGREGVNVNVNGLLVACSAASFPQFV